MNKLLKIVFGVFAVITVAIGAVFFFTADMVGVADEFFLAAKRNQFGKAYLALSQDFQSATSIEDLKAYLEKNALTKFKVANWESRSINGGRGELKGSITTDTGGVVPISLSFVKGEDGWRIYAIKKPVAGLQQESENGEGPSHEEQVRLVQEATHVFAVSVNEKKMDKFYSHISKLWQKQITTAQLDEAFSAFYSLGVDLTLLDQYQPKFSSVPVVNEDGVLEIAGMYETKPNQVHFTQKYLYEGLDWKLVGFKFNIE